MKLLLYGSILISLYAGLLEPVAQETEPAEEIPLSKQIEGLAPEPRIAYLRYLLRTGGVEEAEVYFQLGVAFHESSQLDSAQFYYTKATEVAPDYAKAYVNLGVLYDSQGRLVEALSMFDKAADVNPDDILAHAHAAFIRFQWRDYSGAWHHLSRALSIDPDHPQPHFYLAIFFWESKMYREALAEWETVIELDAGSDLARRARENMNLLQRVLHSPLESGNKELRK